MLPAVCLALFGLCLLLLLLVLIPILGAVFKDEVKKALDEEAQKKQQEEQTVSIAAVLIVAWFIVAICAGLFTFLFHSSFSSLLRSIT